MVPGILGRAPPKQAWTSYSFTLGWLRGWSKIWPNPEPDIDEATFVLHHFLLELTGLIFCDTLGYCVSFSKLPNIIDTDRLDQYDWVV